jgi:hypothetical protein
MRRFRKAGMSAAAVALAASGIVVLFAMPASAKSSGPKGKITCTAMGGSVSGGTITISGCSGTATPGTGGSSTTLSISVLAGGGDVTWINGQVTDFGTPSLGSANAKHCPGYVKGAASEPAVTKFSGSVLSDNTGLKVPGKYKGEVCIKNDASGTISAAKPLKIS